MDSQKVLGDDDSAKDTLIISSTASVVSIVNEARLSHQTESCLCHKPPEVKVSIFQQPCDCSIKVP